MKRNRDLYRSIPLLVAGVLLICSAGVRASDILGDMNIFMRHRVPSGPVQPKEPPVIPLEQQNVVAGVVLDLDDGQFRVTVENMLRHEVVTLRVGDKIANGEIIAISVNPQSGIEYRKNGSTQTTWIPLGSTLAAGQPATAPAIRTGVRP